LNLRTSPKVKRIGGLFMSRHTLEDPFSPYEPETLQDQSGEEKNIDHSSAMIPARAIPSRRRSEVRVEYRCKCSYGMRAAIEQESALIEQGVAFILNRSVEGLLLLMGQAPYVKQLIEVYTPRSRWSETANIFEARWSRPVPVESFGNLYLVGCRRTFGPRHYLSF
jgi:hypothetical protein